MPPRTAPSIDFEVIADRADLPAILAAEGIELHRGLAFCPFHANERTPALSVFRREGRWRWKCWGCGLKGDSIDWVAERARVARGEAARKLAGDLGYEVQAPNRPERPVKPPRVERPERFRDPAWQRAVEALVESSERRLWSGEGAAARDWLRARGLADATIRRFRLGFVAASHRSEAVPILAGDKGEGRVFAPRGITIPWVAPRASYQEDPDQPDEVRWVGCNVRRLADGDVSAGLPEGVRKYQVVLGSSRGFLYPWPDVLPTQGLRPMLLVEGELDALVGWQAVGHRLHVATAGSASVRSLPLASRSALTLTTWLLLAMDYDAAGVKAVRTWREMYPHKSRRVLLPYGKDLSEFVLGGGDPAAWVAGLLAELVHRPSLDPSSEPTPHDFPQESPR